MYDPFIDTGVQILLHYTHNATHLQAGIEVPKRKVWAPQSGADETSLRCETMSIGQ